MILREDVRDRDKIDTAFLRHSLNLVANILEMRGQTSAEVASDTPALLHHKVFRYGLLNIAAFWFEKVMPTSVFYSGIPYQNQKNRKFFEVFS